jgi:hypothetical protein
MKQYILIVREDIRTSRPDSELKEIIDLHIHWAKELSAKGIFINGYGLNGQGILLEMIDHEIHERPIPYPEIAFGGLYIILAESLEAAIEIGKGCPTFSIGDKIEVRELI